MKWFKKILFTILIIIAPIFSSAQSGYQYVDASNCYQWIKLSNSQCGKASFYIYVDKVYNNGSRLYYYNIYLWSDSYYNNCNTSSTYISNINVYAFNNGKYSKAFGVPYLLAKPKSNYFNGWNFLGYVYTYSSNQSIKITWEDISLY